MNLEKDILRLEESGGRGGGGVKNFGGDAADSRGGGQNGNDLK